MTQAACEHRWIFAEVLSYDVCEGNGTARNLHPVEGDPAELRFLFMQGCKIEADPQCGPRFSGPPLSRTEILPTRGTRILMQFKKEGDRFKTLTWGFTRQWGEVLKALPQYRIMELDGGQTVMICQVENVSRFDQRNGDPAMDPGRPRDGKERWFETRVGSEEWTRCDDPRPIAL